MVNKVTLVGHLGQDPEVRKLENGTPVGRFSLATSENYKDPKDPNAEWQTQTEWHNVVVWRNLAEQAEKTLKKGSLAYVEGKISSRKYTDKNGVERTTYDIVALTFRSMTKREGSGGGNFPSEEPVSAVGNNVSNVSFEVVTPSGDAPEPQAGDDLPF